MGITKSNLESMNWENELLQTQESRIKTLKATILILEETIKLKDERIDMLNDLLYNPARSVSDGDR